MIAATDALKEKKEYWRNELRSLGVEPRDLNEKQLADMLDFAKQEQYDNYKKAYPTE